MMTIIEQSITGKAGTTQCEDGIVTTGHFVAVVDGSTSKSHCRFHPTWSNGRLCMSMVCDALREMDAQTSCEEFCRGVSKKIHALYEAVGADMERLRTHPTERMAASAAVYSQTRGEVWLIGDCQCLIDGQGHDNPKPYEDLIAEMRSAYIRLQLVQGMQTSDFQEHDKGRDYILPVLVDSCRYQNVTFAVIDGFDMPLSKVRVIDVSGAEEIVLATDGYPELYPTLKASEEALARQLADDPLCIYRHKATKGMMRGRVSFDDRSYIRFCTGLRENRL